MNASSLLLTLLSLANLSPRRIALNFSPAPASTSASAPALARFGRRTRARYAPFRRIDSDSLGRSRTWLDRDGLRRATTGFRYLSNSTFGYFFANLPLSSLLPYYDSRSTELSHDGSFFLSISLSLSDSRNSRTHQLPTTF